MPNNTIRVDFIDEPNVLTHSTFELMPPMKLHCLSWKEGDAFIAPGNLLIQRNWPKEWNPLILGMVDFIKREEEEGHKLEPKGEWHYTDDHLASSLAESGFFEQSPYKEIIRGMHDPDVDLTLCLEISMFLAGTPDLVS